MSISASEIPPVIAAARSFDDAELIASVVGPTWVFVLGGSTTEIIATSRRLRELSCEVFIDVDMVRGVSRDADGVRLIREYAFPRGVISTHANVIGSAKRLGLDCIQRFFLLDSQAVESGLKQVARGEPDVIEILPGVLPEMIRKVKAQISQPLIAGGLIVSREQVEAALAAGAAGISSSSVELLTSFVPLPRGRDSSKKGVG